MEKIKNSRVKSFIFMALIYLVAIVGGILVYEVLPFNSYVSLLIADIVATAITYLYSVIFENASVYDPYWSVAPIVIAVYLALSYGFNTLSTLIFIAVLFWA
jgi:steroid 5-alpha reductase family enzyme